MFLLYDITALGKNNLVVVRQNGHSSLTVLFDMFQTEAHVDTLISEQAAYVLNRVGLSHIYSCVQQQADIKVSKLL